MSIYKGGYILADISDTALTNEAQDLLSQELKNYISKYLSNTTFQFSNEVLFKPIKLLANVDDNTVLLTFNIISDDKSELLACVIRGTTSYKASINQDLNISATITELA